MESDFTTNILTLYYGFDKTKIIIEPIKLGAENTNYSVTAGEQRYVLRIYSSEHSIRGIRSQDSIEQELEFMQKAAQYGVPTPRARELLRGGILGNNNNVYFVLFYFIAGDHPGNWNDSVVRQLAQVVSKLYRAGSSFNQVSNMGEFSIIERALTKYETLCKPQTLQNFVPIKTLQNLHHQIIADKPSLKLLKMGIIHGDIKLENTIFFNNKLKAILDFDDYRHSYLIEETVATLMHNLHDPVTNCIRSGKYDKFIQGISNTELSIEIANSLKTLLRARLLYDICKYANDNNQLLINEILADKHVIAKILS